MPQILCDSQHRYTVDGSPVPGVHEIMDDVLGRPSFGGVSPEVLAAAQDFGSAMHDWCQFEDEGGSLTDLPEALRPRLEAWRAFKKAVEWKTQLRETMVWHPTGYCGRLDYTGSMLVKSRRRDALLDLKKGRPGERPRLQTAAYKLAVCRELPAFMPVRAVLELRDNGTFKFELYEDRADETKWLSVVQVHYLRKEFAA